MAITISGFTIEGGFKIEEKVVLPSGSIVFNGSTRYIASPASSAFNFGTGDYTIEGWVYPTASTRQDWINVTNESTFYRIAFY